MSREVAIYSDVAQSMQEDWQLIDDLKGGTRAMRAAGQRYLPRRPMESVEDYQARLSMATLLPAFTETVGTLAGRVFSEPVTYNDDIPVWIRDDIIPDVDLQGRDLQAWAMEWFREALEYGMSHVLVDAPRVDGVRTLAEQLRAGVRPYLVKIHPRQVLGWRETNGTLTQVRVQFERTEDEGEFGTREVPEIWVYDLSGGRVRVRRFRKGTSREEWVQTSDDMLDLGRIPLITLYTNRTGFMTANPPLRELAFLNIKHWRMQNSNDTLLETASVPILAISGVTDSDDIMIGAKHAIRLPIGAAMQYVEHSGAAIGAGRQGLKDLVTDMRQAGAKLLQPQEISRTATEAREDAAKDNSLLGGMASQLQDTLVDVLDLIAEYRGQESGGTVQLNPNLDPELDTATAMQDLLSMYREGIISRSTVFEGAKRFGRLPDGVQWEDEQARIADEGPQLPDNA